MKPFFEAWASRGREKKEWRERPLLYPDLKPIWEAFEWLSMKRNFEPMSGIPLPISDFEIMTYLDLFGYTDPEERQEVAELVTAMDLAYRAHVAEEKEEKEKAGKNGNSPGTHQRGRGETRRG
jgi:hypothetical protein